MTTQMSNHSEDVVKAALADWGVPQSILDNIFIDDMGGIWENDGDKLKMFGEYAYFEWIEQPLIYFVDKQYRSQRYTPTYDSPLGIVPRFAQSLTEDREVCLEFCNEDATIELYDFLCYRLHTHHVLHEPYQIVKRAKCSMQKMTPWPYEKGEPHFRLVFKAPEHAQAVVDWINANYIC